MKNILATSCLALSIFLALPALSGHHENKGDGDSPMMKNAATAKNWIKAQYTSKDKALKMVKKHMAEDGISFPGRFIGFGFTYNPDTDDRAVDTVIKDSPAAKILKPGDTFVSVNGVPATKENWDNGKLSFGGAPGEKVDVVINRNGKQKKASFKRGLVNPTYTKAQVISNIEDSNADNWGAIKYEIRELAGNKKENSVYVWSWHKSTNSLFDIDYEEHVVTRFGFNDAGKVIAISSLSEQELVQSQLGFTVTR